MDSLLSTLFDHSLLLPGVVLGMTLHEMAHAIVAYRAGARGADSVRRMAFEPVTQVNWLGAFMFFLVGWGWSKPLRVDPTQFRRPNWGLFFTALAGPLTNLGIGMLFYGFSVLSVGFAAAGMPEGTLRGPLLNFYNGLGEPAGLSVFVGVATFHAARANFALALINLLPLPPFDGFWVVYAITRWWQARRGAAPERAKPGMRPQTPRAATAPPPVADFGALLFRDAARLQAGRKWAQAREAYERLLLEDPYHRGAALNLGQVYERLGNRFEAARAYGRAYLLSTDDGARSEVTSRLAALDVPLADVLAVQPPPFATATVGAGGRSFGPAGPVMPRRVAAGPEVSTVKRGWRVLALGLFLSLGVLHLAVFPSWAIEATGPEAFLTPLRAAQTDWENGRPSAAEAQLQTALEHAELIYAQPGYSAARATTAAAATQLARVAPDVRNVIVLQALVELDAGRASAALKRLKAIPEPRGFWAEFYLGNAYAQLGYWDLAEDAWESASGLRPTHAGARSNLAFAAYQRGDYGAAERAATQALEQDGYFAFAWKNRALVALTYQTDEQNEDAYWYGLLSVAFAPDEAAAHAVFSRALFARGDVEWATREEAAATRLQSTRFNVYH